jgi:hypothetical protein
MADASLQAGLVYGRSGAAESCPDESSLRRAVAARVGYDPFFPMAPQTAVVTIADEGGRLVAHIQLVDEAGRAHGARELDSALADCGSLFDTVVLTVSIAIDPHVGDGGGVDRSWGLGWAGGGSPAAPPLANGVCAAP